MRVSGRRNLFINILGYKSATICTLIMPNSVFWKKALAIFNFSEEFHEFYFFHTVILVRVIPLNIGHLFLQS